MTLVRNYCSVTICKLPLPTHKASLDKTKSHTVKGGRKHLNNSSCLVMSLTNDHFVFFLAMGYSYIHLFYSYKTVSTTLFTDKNLPMHQLLTACHREKKANEQ